MDNGFASRELAIRNADHSLRMEGFVVDNKTKKLCEKLLLDEITFDEYMKEIKTKLGIK